MAEIIQKKVFRDLKKEVVRLKEKCAGLEKENEEIKKASETAPVAKKETSEKEEAPDVLKKDLIVSQDSINVSPDVSYAPDVYGDDVPITAGNFNSTDAQVIEFEKQLEEKGKL